MPTYTVEFKSSSGDMKEAKLQCAYDGAPMTEGTRAMHKHIGKSNKDFSGKTLALTVAFNGETLKFYGHHVVKIPTSSQPAASDAVDTLQYHQYLYTSDTRDSFENFQSAYKHTRNAEDFGYNLATKRKDALWAHANADNTRTSPDVDDDGREGEDEPSNQLLAEHYTNFAEDNQDERATQKLPANNGCTSDDALTCTPITLPQSSKDSRFRSSHSSCRCWPLRYIGKMLTLMYTVIGGLAGQRHAPLILSKG
jgi:hypothetical protein